MTTGQTIMRWRNRQDDATRTALSAWSKAIEWSLDLPNDTTPKQVAAALRRAADMLDTLS